MNDIRIKRALISVYDKTGVVEFARALQDEFGVEIISTGGTAGLFRENNIPVSMVEEITGFAEMMDGRVKTLHPRIHAAILADRNNPEHVRQLAEQDIEPIDMVVVNLYPFEKTVAEPDCSLEQAIEMIDIGGPCLLRAAAKNHQAVVPICDARQYEPCLELLRRKGTIDARQRLGWATFAYLVTSDYDEEVAEYLATRSGEHDIEKAAGAEETGVLPDFLGWDASLGSPLRYGENPHQVAGLYELDYDREGHTDAPGLAQAEILQGEMSFNNYVDASAALELCRELTLASRRNEPRAICVYVKHTNACGVGAAVDPMEAYRQAYLGDPLAAMGGVLAVNFKVEAALAEAIMDSLERWGRAAGAGAFFAEVWMAPSFEPEALQIIREKKQWGTRVRLLGVGAMDAAGEESQLGLKEIRGGMLVQSRDNVGLNEDQWQVATRRRPTDLQMNDLRLAWLICKHTKSNAITICRDGMLLGNGAGQMSRVMSCRIATWLAQENGHQDRLRGAAAASDAFFPFRDGPDALMDAGLSAIIQPGGSKRDAETIAACDERGVAMVFTGTRHFKH